MVHAYDRAPKFDLGFFAYGSRALLLSALLAFMRPSISRSSNCLTMPLSRLLAPSNMAIAPFMSTTFPVSQLPIGWLNAVAFRKAAALIHARHFARVPVADWLVERGRFLEHGYRPSMVVTLLVSQATKGLARVPAPDVRIAVALSEKTSRAPSCYWGPMGLPSARSPWAARPLGTTLARPDETSAYFAPCRVRSSRSHRTCQLPSRSSKHSTC